jgi:hypothetical protein
MDELRDPTNAIDNVARLIGIDGRGTAGERRRHRQEQAFLRIISTEAKTHPVSNVEPALRASANCFEQS